MAEAVEILAQGDFTVVAGATDVYPPTVGRRLHINALDPTGIDELKGISRSPDPADVDPVDADPAPGDSATDGQAHWRIGACTTWQQLADADLPAQFAALQSAARQVGGVQVQNRGTLAGNLVTASPAGDGIPVLLSLSAQVEVASVRGTRLIDLADFVTGYRQTALAADELVTAVLVPSRPGPSDFQKLGSRSHLVISIAMVATHLEEATKRIRIAVGACSPVAVRLRDLEARLAADGAGDAVALVNSYPFDELSTIDDVRGSAAYREQVVRELVVRSIEGCRARIESSS